MIGYILLIIADNNRIHLKITYFDIWREINIWNIINFRRSDNFTFHLRKHIYFYENHNMSHNLIKLHWWREHYKYFRPGDEFISISPTLFSKITIIEKAKFSRFLSNSLPDYFKTVVRFEIGFLIFYNKIRK